MAWHLYYGGIPVMKYNSLASVESHQAEIAEVIDAGGGWFRVDHPRGEGLGTHKLYLTPGVAIMFREVDD